MHVKNLFIHIASTKEVINISRNYNDFLANIFFILLMLLLINHVPG
jgi:hypothetical protein